MFQLVERGQLIMKNITFSIVILLSSMLFLPDFSYSQDLTVVLRAIEKYQAEMKKIIDSESSKRKGEIKSIKSEINEITTKVNNITNGNDDANLKYQISVLEESVGKISSEINTIRERTTVKESAESEKVMMLAQNLQTLTDDLKIAIKKNKEEVKTNPVQKKSVIKNVPKLGMHTKVRYYYDEYEPDNATFQVKEARASVKGEVNSYLSYKFQAELAGTPKLLDANVGVKLASNISMTVGQFKAPFSTGYLLSSKALHFVNRELMKNIEPGRDLGVQFSSKIPSAKLNLIAGVFNGASINTADNNRYKNIVLRGIISPVKGLDIAGNYYSGKTDAELNPDNMEKLGGSISVKHNRIVFLSEYIKSTTGILTGDGFYSILGYSIQSKHTLFKEFEPIIRYEEFDNNVDFYGDSINRVTLGLNIYFHNRNNKFQINYQINNEEENKISDNELLTNFQVSF